MDATETPYIHITPLVYAKELATGEGTQLNQLINNYVDMV